MEGSLGTGATLLSVSFSVLWIITFDLLLVVFLFLGDLDDFLFLDGVNDLDLYLHLDLDLDLE